MRRFIRRAVIHDDDLAIFIILLKKMIETVGDIFFFIFSRDDDRDLKVRFFGPFNFLYWRIFFAKSGQPQDAAGPDQKNKNKKQDTAIKALSTYFNF